MCNPKIDTWGAFVVIHGHTHMKRGDNIELLELKSDLVMPLLLIPALIL